MTTSWIIVEVQENALLPAAFELAAAARSITDEVVAVTWSTINEDGLAELGAHGVEQVLEIGDVGSSLPAPRVSAAIAEAISNAEAPDVVLIPASHNGRDVAARLSARLDRPVLTNVVGLENADGSLVSEHPLFGGTEIARARFTSQGPNIYVVRPKTFVAEEVGGNPAQVRTLVSVEVGAADAAQIAGFQKDERTGPSLDEADVIVAGGRGLGSDENFSLIEHLAQLVKGAPAASRAIVDQGWAPYACQVGQTGKTVKPAMYMAFGISGATQHLVGMKSSQYIIAVNRDESAPIFEIADLGIVGNALEILPKLISELEARQ